MTTTANWLLENCCSPCCGWDGGCNNKWTINIESTKPECLRVDTSECWVVKLEPVCPPEVIAWENIIVDTVICEDDESCSKKYIVNANCKDEKVKACPKDTKPWTLIEKLEAWHAITITANWCDWDTDAALRIDVDEDKLKIEYPPIKVVNNSNTVKLTVSWDDWHTITISDKEDSTYDNVCCLGFTTSKDYTDVEIDSNANSKRPRFVWEEGKNWDIFTGNPAMATSKWIKILADGYYRVFWQITVVNNINDDPYFNLWRWLLRIDWNTDVRPALGSWYLSTAKHWAYARQIILQAWDGINVSNDWVISEWSWEWQSSWDFDWPWMTYNIDVLVDLRKWDIVTVWYRPQSNMNEAKNKIWSFRFVWKDDSSTHFQALFWGTVIWVHQLAPKLFQNWASNKVYDSI